MKRFILFIVLALPVVAVLSMAAGFIYAGNMRRVPAAQAAQPAPAATLAPVVTVPAQADDYSKLLRIQLSFCFQSFKASASGGSVDGVHICAANIRKMQPPAAWAMAHSTALRLADELDAYASDLQVATRNTDNARMDAAIKRVQPIGEMFKELVNVLPE